jgi:hypothetical protein
MAILQNRSFSYADVGNIFGNRIVIGAAAKESPPRGRAKLEGHKMPLV